MRRTERAADAPPLMFLLLKGVLLNKRELRELTYISCKLKASQPHRVQVGLGLWASRKLPSVLEPRLRSESNLINQTQLITRNTY